MGIFEEIQMEGLSGEEQAKQAITHVLKQIRYNEKVGYHLGIGTQSFSLLTEAAATLHGEPVDVVRARYMP